MVWALCISNPFGRSISLAGFSCAQKSLLWIKSVVSNPSCFNGSQKTRQNLHFYSSFHPRDLRFNVFHNPGRSRQWSVQHLKIFSTTIVCATITKKFCFVYSENGEKIINSQNVSWHTKIWKCSSFSGHCHKFSAWKQQFHQLITQTLSQFPFWTPLQNGPPLICWPQNCRCWEDCLSRCRRATSDDDRKHICIGRGFLGKTCPWNWAWDRIVEKLTVVLPFSFTELIPCTMGFKHAQTSLVLFKIVSHLHFTCSFCWKRMENAGINLLYKTDILYKTLEEQKHNGCDFSSFAQNILLYVCRWLSCTIVKIPIALTFTAAGTGFKWWSQLWRKAGVNHRR